MFDDVYCTRLWCIWELATFLKLREKPKVTFVCMSLRSCGVILVLVYMCERVLTNAVFQWSPMSCTSNDDILSGKCDAVKLDVQSWQNYFGTSTVLIGSCALASAGFIFGQRHFRNDAKLRSMIESYDIRTAQSAKEDDKEVEEKFEKYFRYLARCEGKFCTTTLII